MCVQADSMLRIPSYPASHPNASDFQSPAMSPSLNHEHSSGGESVKKEKDVPVENHRPIRVIVIGAGFSGVYAAIRIPQRIRNVELVVYEKNAGIGGTWWENRYPGCACDIPAHSYQYSFDPNPNWSKFYAPAAEIRDYIGNVARKFGADRFIKLRHRIDSCSWDDSVKKWKVNVEVTETGQMITDEADVLVSARGMLNDIAWPDVQDLKSFKGPLMHSAAWDDTIDFVGKRIGIIGAGSSGIQIVPQLQKVQGTTLSCFVRGRTWITPPFGDSAVAKLREEYPECRLNVQKRACKNCLAHLSFMMEAHTCVHLVNEENFSALISDPERYHKFRKLIEAEGNSLHALTIRDSQFQAGARAYFAQSMRERLTKKPEIMNAIEPAFAAGCRRLTPGAGYLEALTEPNVDFITTDISRVLPNGIELKDGRVIELDVLVCATGFRTSAPPPFAVKGRDGRMLESQFKPRPSSYLSVCTDAFPNFFMLLGPNSAIGTGSLTIMIESTGDYIVKCIRKIQKEDVASMEVKSELVDDFMEYVDIYFKKTVYLDQCRSWYRNEGGGGDKIIGLWPGSTLHAVETFRSPRWEDFEYEMIGGKSANKLRWLGNGWSALQVDGGDVAYYLEPEVVDVPRHYHEGPGTLPDRAFSH